jgi:aryl-alcohol dehydrogenase-like predicted oxidoreductase
MLPKVTFGRSGLTTSRIGFGTSRLHYLPTGRAREEILRRCVELGITHLDTAPLYGDGLAEIEIGRTFRGRRDSIVLVTKYGLPPSPRILVAPWATTPIRAARALARRIGFRAKVPPLTGAGLIASVEQSLRRLGFDHIELLLLHDPSLSRIPNPERLRDALQSLKSRGLIGGYGLAGNWDSIRKLSVIHPELSSVIQTSERAWDSSGRVPDITFGALAPGPQRIGQTRIDEQLAETRLREALARRPNGVVLVSSTKLTHIEQIAHIATSASNS